MARTLTPEEKDKLRRLFREHQSTGLPEDHPDRAWVEFIRTGQQTGDLIITQEEHEIVQTMLRPPQSLRDIEAKIPAPILALLPGWVRPLLRTPIIGPILAAVISAITWIFHRGVTRMVTAWMGVATVASLNTMFRLSPALARRLGEQISRGAEVDPKVWTTIVANIVRQITGREVSSEVLERASDPTAVAEAASGLARYIFDSFTGFIAPTAPLTPEKGRDAAVRYLSLNMTLQMTSWYLGLVHEFMSLGISRSLKDLPVQISWSMGLGWLSWLVFGVPFRAAITDPLETLYNITYQFERYTVGQAIALRKAGLLDDHEYIRAMAERGYDYDKARALLTEAMNQPTLAELRRWYEQGLIDEERLQSRIQRLGYEQGDAWRITRSIVLERTQDELNKLVATTERLYGKGKVGQDWLMMVWRMAGLTTEEQDLRLMRLELERQDDRTLTKSEILDAYRDAAIDEVEARRRLRELGYDDRDIDILMRREERKLGPAQVVDAAIRGLISREEALRRLREQGYPEEDAALLLSLRQRELTPGQILDALDQGLISTSDARRRLMALGYSEELAALMLAFQRRQLTPGDIQAALLRGLMTKDEAMERLLRLGYSREDAEILLELRWRVLSPGQVLDALLSDLVTLREALARLVELGYRPEDAELVLMTLLEKRGH